MYKFFKKRFILQFFIMFFGKLPLRNVYAAGQSSLLPGVIGAMMSAFIVGRSIEEKEDYARFLSQRLGS